MNLSLVNIAILAGTGVASYYAGKKGGFGKLLKGKKKKGKKK